MKLSDNFSMEEFTSSDWGERHGVDNQPKEADIIANLHELALEMERIRKILHDNIIFVRSAYRSPKVNIGVGGAPSSAHLDGLACDFVCPGYGSTYEVAKAIEDSNLSFDQLILEGVSKNSSGWVHIGFPDVGKPHRKEIMTASFPNGKVRYQKGLIKDAN